MTGRTSGCCTAAFTMASTPQFGWRVKAAEGLRCAKPSGMPSSPTRQLLIGKRRVHSAHACQADLRLQPVALVVSLVHVSAAVSCDWQGWFDESVRWCHESISALWAATDGVVQSLEKATKWLCAGSSRAIMPIW